MYLCLGDRKREGVPSSLTPAAKKPKVSSSSVVSNVVVGRSSSSSSTANVGDAWESIAIEVEGPDLVPKIVDACNADDLEKVVCNNV